MSKIDYITIAVVVICISLLGLVFWKVADLNWAEENIQETEESVQVADEEEEAAPFLDENYDVTDFVAEDSTTDPIETTPVVVPKEEKIKEKVIIKEPPQTKYSSLIVLTGETVSTFSAAFTGLVSMTGSFETTFSFVFSSSGTTTGVVSIGSVVESSATKSVTS